MDNHIATVRTGIDLPKKSVFVLNSLFLPLKFPLIYFTYCNDDTHVTWKRMWDYCVINSYNSNRWKGKSSTISIIKQKLKCVNYSPNYLFHFTLGWLNKFGTAMIYKVKVISEMRHAH